MSTLSVTGPGPAPQPPEGDEPGVQAFDHLGNPICPGCGEGPLQWAARQNSGAGRCGCPTDPRVSWVGTRAQALRLIRDALDELDATCPAICRCTVCRARRILLGERVL
jgi:hypothetical protein